MRLSNVREAPCIRANLLLNQANSKKGFKTIQPEINKMSEIFGIDFDKHLYKSLFDEIDFKDLKPLLTNKNCPNKLQYFVQEFPAFIERSDFVNIFSQILMTTTNISTAVEIFEGLNKMAKLSYENQFKLIISFIYSMNDRFVDDAKNILVAKCHELLKENKGHGLSESTVQTLLLFINSMDGLKTDPFFGNSFISFLIQDTEGNNDDMKQIELIQSMVETSPDEPIEMEKMLHDLGPFTVNGGITFANGDLLDFKLDEKRLAGFIIFLIKHQSWVEDKESRYLNKVFLKSLNNDAAIAIDENIEKKQTVYWNMDQFYKMFKNQIDSMDMAQVFNFFDDPLFCVKDKKTFEYLMTTLQKLKGTNYNNLLFNLIFKRWNNELNQIEFLNFLIHNTQVELFSFKNSPGRKVKKNFELGITVNKTAVFHLIESWSCIDLLEVLLKLSKGNYYMKIKEMFDWPIANVPELIVIGLAMIKAEPDDFLYEEIINEALPIFLGNHVNSLVVLEETWNLNKDLVIKTICHMYRSNPDLMNLSRILDITQKLKESLIPIVSCKDYVFAVNLAILAVKRDFLHIDQWLSERIARVGDEFIESLLNFIKENVIALCKDVTNPVIKENILEKCQLSLESLAIIFENLTPSKIGKNPRVSKRIEAEITNTYKAIFEIFDELQVQPPNSEEIEEAANKFYQNLFHGDITVEEIIEKMKTYKNSPNHKESEIYACMIHSLLDEYRFFHQYPDKELKIIANLFGQIINQKLLDGIIETIALKYVLEGIKKGSGNMFTFATIALEQFVDKLHLWPQYLQSLTEIPALKNYPTLHDRVIEKLNETISKSKQKVEESFNGKGANNPIITIEDKSHNKAIERELQESLKNVTNTSSNIIRKTNIDSAPFIPSSANVSNFAHFIPDSYLYGNKQKKDDLIDEYEHDMNKFTPKAEDDKKIKKDLESKIVGLGQASFNSSDNKANKPKTILSRPPQVSSGIGNLAQILTVESESALQAPHQEIIEKINVIFNSMSKNNIADKSNELKMLLTNENTLRWFSNFFILNRVSVENNNHPIYNELITLIDLKELNQLLIKDTISFIKKLLVSENLAKDPREKNVLKNLGSWLGIMTLAKNKPILAKDLDLKEIIFEAYENGKLGAIIIFVGRILEHSAKTKVFHAKNPWIQAILSLLAELNFKPFLKHNMKFEIENIFKKLEVELSNYPQSRLLDAIIVCQNSLDFTKPQTAVVNEPQIESFNLQELIGRISSLDQYVSDVMSFLINKIPSHIQISKSDIVTILTNSLANAINEILNPVVERAVNISQVTTRELVLKDFACERDDAKFKNAANLCIKALAGSLAMVTCKEPLRIGYNNQLKEFLTKKGIENEIIEALNNTLNNTEILEIGCNFIQSYVIKRAVDKIERDKIIIDEMDKRKKNKIIEAKPDLITKIKTLPEILRPNPSGLTADQYKIYEDFEHAYDSTSKYENNGGNNKITVLKMIVPALREVLDSYSSSTPQTRIINKYEFCMFNIQFIAKRNESAELAEEDEQIGILSKIIYDAKISDVTLASELANCTYKYVINESKVHNLSLVNIYSEILKGWVKLHPQLSKEITNKLLNSEDIQSRFKFEVHYYLIKKHLIDMGTYETILADYLEEVSMNNEVRKLITNLIRRNALTLTHFKRIPIYMIDPTLNYWEIFGKKHTVQQSAPSIIDFKICNIKDISTFQRFAEMCKFAYNQMINAMYQNYDVEKVRIKLKDFIDSPFVKNEEQMNVFIMIITELAIKGELCYDPENNFYPESEARCIMGLLTIIPSTMNKLKIFENILFGIFKVFHYDYVKNTPNFNQKPYFKLLYNIIHYINGLEANDELFTGGYKKFQFFAIFADVLRVLNPLNYPGFGLAWLDLVSSKIFSGAFLEIDPSLRLKDHIPKYEKYLFIVIDTLSYLKSYNCDLLADYNSKTFVDQVYKLMYLISSSYPEFLSYYYYIILASLPAGDCYIQMKNIILHCAPSDIEQPNPFYDEFKVDSLPDIRKNSVVLFDIASILQEYGFKGMIDEYIETKSDATLDELLKKLNNNRKEKDQSQNYFIINAIVIYWSQNIIKTNSEKKMKNTEVLEFFIKMIRNLDNDNRDHLINSILNELRYPSNQTYYFSCLLLCIFFEIKNELIEEHILRNILERLLYKPYPWGLLVTFVELSRHPKYELTKKSYVVKTHSDKIIEELLKFIKTTKINKNLANFVS